jgi:hypothetical protein
VVTEVILVRGMVAVDLWVVDPVDLWVDVVAIIPDVGILDLLELL